MASLPAALRKPLEYSAQFNYPLTASEIWYWQISSHLSLSSIRTALTTSHLKSSRSYYHLPGHQSFVSLRLSRSATSQSKWSTATRLLPRLTRLPTIEAIFITGALAMFNSPSTDDIDIMLVTRPHTLWLTRLLVYLALGHHRRPPSLPEHASPRVSDKICDNLYLDSTHLHINPLSLTHPQRIYIAHEILQAKCIFDRSGIAHQLLSTNSWVGDYLPIAYTESLKTSSSNHLPSSKLISLLFPLNLLAFLLQFIYMKPKITHEHINLHTAFFHPRSVVN